MERIDLHTIRDFAKTLEGATLETQAQRRKFAVQVVPGALIFTPQSTGKARPITDGLVEDFLAVFARSGSLRPGDYQQATVNASYLLALIARYLHR